MATPPSAIATNITLGGLIDDLALNRDKLRKLTEQVDQLKSEKVNLERDLIAAMDAQGIEQSRGKLASASIVEQIVPNVTDWDAFYAYIHRNKSYFLLARRPTSAAYRETLAARRNRPIPGVQPFLRRSITLCAR